MEDRQMLRSSDFMHERAFSILLQISGSLPLYTSMQDPRYRQRNRQPQLHVEYLEGGVEVSSTTCYFVLLQLISSPICEDSSCSISRARTSISNMLASKETHHLHNLNPYRSPHPQLHKENLYGQHGSWSNPLIQWHVILHCMWNKNKTKTKLHPMSKSGQTLFTNVKMLYSM